MARWLPPAFQNGIDIDAVDSAVDMPYDIPNFHVEYVRAEPPAVPTGFWRGVGPNNNYVTARFGGQESHVTAQDVAQLRNQTSP